MKNNKALRFLKLITLSFLKLCYVLLLLDFLFIQHYARVDNREVLNNVCQTV